MIWIPKRHAEALRHRLKVGMPWPEVANVLETEPKWLYVSFRNNSTACGSVSNHDGKLEFMPSGQYASVALNSMNDVAISSQTIDCPHMTVLFKWSFPLIVYCFILSNLKCMILPEFTSKPMISLLVFLIIFK